MISTFSSLGGYTLEMDDRLARAQMTCPVPPLARTQAALVATASGPKLRLLVLRRALSPRSPEGSRMRRCGEVNHKGERFRCNRPPCPNCGAYFANRFSRKLLVPFSEVADLAGARLFFATIVLRPTDDIWQVGEIAASAKRSLRHIRDKLARRRPVLANMFVFGALEVGLVPDNEFRLLGAHKQKTLRHLRFPDGTAGGPVWTPHFHMLMGIPEGADPNEVKAAVTAIFDGPYQVQFRPVIGNGAIKKHVKRIGRYAFKHQMLTDVLPQHTRSWDIEEVATYIRWAADFSSRGFRGFRFQIGRWRFQNHASDIADEWVSTVSRMEAAFEDYIECPAAMSDGESDDGRVDRLSQRRHPETVASGGACHRSGGRISTRWSPGLRLIVGARIGSLRARWEASLHHPSTPLQRASSRGPPVAGL